MKFLLLPAAAIIFGLGSSPEAIAADSVFFNARFALGKCIKLKCTDGSELEKKLVVKILLDQCEQDKYSSTCRGEWSSVLRREGVGVTAKIEAQKFISDKCEAYFHLNAFLDSDQAVGSMISIEPRNGVVTDTVSFIAPANLPLNLHHKNEGSIIPSLELGPL